MKSTKYAICSIIELTNRLGSLSVSSTNSTIPVSAVDKALHCHQKNSLPNLSALNYLKRKVNTDRKDKTTAATPWNKKNCRVCHNHFKEPQEIYSSSHRANSSKCSYLATIDRKRPHEQKSGGNGMTDKIDKELLVSNPTCIKVKIKNVDGDDDVINKNDPELLVSNPTGINVKIEKVHNDKLINISNSIKREANANEESSDDQSTYTTADNFDPDKVSFEGKCKEQIRLGDVIQ